MRPRPANTGRHLLPSRRFIPPGRTVGILSSVLDALDYAHRQHIIHWDIKPANILIETHTNRPIITDFGIARLLRGPSVETPRIVGTPVYMSREQILGGPVDARADIYSVGVVLFEMLATDLPLPLSTEDVKRLSLHSTNRALDRYLEIDVAELRAGYALARPTEKDFRTGAAPKSKSRRLRIGSPS
ncbi:protein kinase domain-containing protein [Syntrophobacter fumaroxidans]|uniref:Serine/threonine protein kinase n=1 Tax=Syntrophobacter fumaroxidans (strain DSM 10017 / MPOB) TaxID=335543 RepID=A0LG32_SYNFM|nr:protein kinase [Syntrophobacter fumaroxidans]ABK16384.1 serine/threonine protein kinase [Syntrophobacter fumaroxidans MPOB]